MDSKANRLALKVALTYVGLAACWILFSDELIGIFIPDPEERFHLSIYKGLGFVLLTGGLLYQLLQRSVRRWERESKERLQAEAALRESEFFFKESQRAARIGSYKTDFTTGIWDSSEVLDQILGISRSYRRNIEGWLELVHPGDRQMMESYLRDEVMAGRRPFIKEYRIIRQNDGQTRWVSGLGEVACDAAGVPVTLIGTIQDVTERKQMEIALLEQLATRERVAAITTTVPGVIYSFLLRPDGSNCFPYASPAVYEHFGVTGEQLAGDGSVIFASIHPDDVGRVQTDIAESARTLSTWWGEFRYRHPVRGEIWISARSEPKRQADGGILWHGFTMEVTESKQAAEKLARLAIAVEQAAESISITDTRGTIVYVNPAFEKISGYTSAEAIGQNPRLLKSGQQDDEFYRRMWVTIRDGGIWSGHFVNRRKDGSLYQEEATISPIRDATGKIVNYVAVKRDVTRELQLENQFQQAQKMEAIGTLAGGIAHDFNNILAAMFGYGYLLKQDVAGNVAAEESIDEILNAAGRAKDLVQQILTFSRQREQKRQVVRLNTVVKEAVKFLRASLPAGIHINLEVDIDAPAILGDPTQIYQIILNLATNSFHAMEGKNGKLTVSLQTFEPDEDFIKAHPGMLPVKHTHIMVSDTGQGMDELTLRRIFEPFFTTKPVGKGTGLGLAVVHGIVQSHEGFITVESEVGHGTTFDLYFPSQSEEELPSTVPVNGGVRGNGQSILVVDDEKSLTAVFRRLLNRLGYRVTVSNSPFEALALFSAGPDQFDLVITDLTMPEMNGVELARKIHEIRPELPIVLASGFNAGLDLAKLGECGIHSLLEKPVSMTALTQLLEEKNLASKK